ncbi:hypothetical protein K438DRAFT_455579 [Mycena galopus ATCC 62051]|nr:hypothetical protein K438DRAFT_455579 [Mycena galopus ATCC 62051]
MFPFSPYVSLFCPYVPRFLHYVSLFTLLDPFSLPKGAGVVIQDYIPRARKKLWFRPNFELPMSTKELLVVPFLIFYFL